MRNRCGAGAATKIAKFICCIRGEKQDEPEFESAGYQDGGSAAGAVATFLRGGMQEENSAATTATAAAAGPAGGTAEGRNQQLHRRTVNH
jgi:hypothetical protein